MNPQNINKLYRIDLRYSFMLCINLINMVISKDIVGRRVYYVPYNNCDPSMYEYGIVTSFNDRYVFVRFDGDVNSKACNACDLELDT